MREVTQIPVDLLQQFQAAGRALADAGLVAANSGNVSVRRAGSIVITRHDAELGRLAPNDLVEVPSGVSTHPEASVEILAHLAIYRATDALAIVHAHPPAVIAVSLGEGLDFADPEGRIPIVEGESGSQALADALAEALRNHSIAVARGHGSFAVGESLAEAVERTLRLEGDSRGRR